MLFSIFRLKCLTGELLMGVIILPSRKQHVLSSVIMRRPRTSSDEKANGDSKNQHTRTNIRRFAVITLKLPGSLTAQVQVVIIYEVGLCQQSFALFKKKGQGSL